MSSPHVLTTAQGPAQFDAGIEIEAASHPGFRATALMVALDAGAEAMLKAECDRLRAEAASGDAPGTVIGYGATQTLPA